MQRIKRDASGYGSGKNVTKIALAGTRSREYIPPPPVVSSERFSVLAVDDNEAHCYAMQKILQGFGYNVMCAATGLSAVEKAIAGSFDAILLDIHLPDIDGFEVLAQIRKVKELNQPAVVFHSATSATTSNVSRANGLDAEGFLTHPVEPEHIDAVIRGAIRRRRELKQKASNPASESGQS